MIGAAAQKRIDGISILETSPRPDLIRALRLATADGSPKVAQAALQEYFGTDVAFGERRPDLRLATLIDSAAFRGVPPALLQAAGQIAISPSRFSLVLRRDWYRL